MPTVAVNGIEVYYEQAGEGRPVLLLHGLGSSTRDWEYQTAVLSREYRVITMDVRGHGRSSRPPGPYSVAQFAQDAVLFGVVRTVRGSGWVPAPVVDPPATAIGVKIRIARFGGSGYPQIWRRHLFTLTSGSIFARCCRQIWKNPPRLWAR